MNCGFEDDELTYDPTHTENGYRLKEPAFSADAIPSGKVLDYWLMEGSTTHYQPGDEILFASFDEELPFKFTAVWKDEPVMPAYTTGPLDISMKAITGANVTTNSSQSGGPFASAGTAPVAVSSFMIAETELTYEKWFEVYLWAVSADRDSETGHGKYTFSSKGKGGSTGIYGAIPDDETRNKPVTTIDFRDAVIWCNAASEREGLQPVYFIGGTEGQQFEDSTRVLRDSVSVEISGEGKTVIMPLANGYRLPTAAEWEYAARGGNPSDSTNWGYMYAGSVDPDDVVVYNADEASDVGSKNANGAGLKDMSGNVAEYVWASSMSDCCYVYGGYYELDDALIASLQVDGFDTAEVDDGSEYSGFRVARNEQRSTTELGVTMKAITGKTVRTADAINGGVGPFSTVETGNSSTYITVASYRLGETELLYSKWYDVYQWACEHGYVIANKGQAGSKGTVGAAPSGSTQPVVNISWRDAVVWCNAASEREGLSPVYYLEGTEDFGDVTKVLRTSESLSLASAGNSKAEKAVIDSSANGYRLPTAREWEFAVRGGNPDGAKWNYLYGESNDPENDFGLDFKVLDDYAVYSGKSINFPNDDTDYKSANAKSKKKNDFGLYDMLGNVYEYC